MGILFRLLNIKENVCYKLIKGKLLDTSTTTWLGHRFLYINKYTTVYVSDTYRRIYIYIDLI